MDCRELDFKKTNNKKEMKAITTWFLTGGGSGGDARVEVEYWCLTSMSLKSRTGPSYKRTIMSVSYHMKLFNKFITTIRPKQGQTSRYDRLAQYIMSSRPDVIRRYIRNPYK